MQLEVIGVGGAGCRLADAIRAAEPAGRSFLADVAVFDTDETTVNRTVVPESRRHHYGQGTVADGGLDGDLERGFEIGRERADELLDVVDEEPTANEADAVLVTVGFGGATGGGTVPPLVAALQRRDERPVYVLGTLPADREFDPAAERAGPGNRSPNAGPETRGEQPPRPNAAANAITALERLDGLANAVLLFDNESWLRPGETVADARERCNRELATRIGTVFAGGESESDESGARNVVDASDIARILGDESDLVALGYGDQAVETSGSRFGLGLISSEPDVETSEAVSAIETVVRKGIRGKLTLECDPESAARGLLLVGGPPAWLNRQAIAEGRETLQSIVGGNNVLGGDTPRPDGESVFAAVVLADVESPRLAELRAAAE